MKILMPDEEIPELPEYASELETELAHGQAIVHDPAAGIRAMEERIEGLMAELTALESKEDVDSRTAGQRRIAPLLRDAQRRLAQYKLQRDGKN